LIIDNEKLIPSFGNSDSTCSGTIEHDRWTVEDRGSLVEYVGRFSRDRRVFLEEQADALAVSREKLAVVGEWLATGEQNCVRKSGDSQDLSDSVGLLGAEAYCLDGDSVGAVEATVDCEVRDSIHDASLAGRGDESLAGRGDESLAGKRDESLVGRREAPRLYGDGIFEGFRVLEVKGAFTGHLVGVCGHITTCSYRGGVPIVIGMMRAGP
jgi:hypothetical protein